MYIDSRIILNPVSDLRQMTASAEFNHDHGMNIP
jgi:hypothetical protein